MRENFAIKVFRNGEEVCETLYFFRRNNAFKFADLINPQTYDVIYIMERVNNVFQTIATKTIKEV